MIVWAIDTKKVDVKTVINKVRQLGVDGLDPNKTGFTCTHQIDTFEEVASLARPPIGIIWSHRIK